MTDKKTSQLADGNGLRPSDQLPALRAGANVRVNLAECPTLTSVLPTDSLLVLRDDTLYLSTVAAVLAASAPPVSGGGQFDFSTAINSALAA